MAARGNAPELEFAAAVGDRRHSRVGQCDLGTPQGGAVVGGHVPADRPDRRSAPRDDEFSGAVSRADKTGAGQQPMQGLLRLELANDRLGLPAAEIVEGEKDLLVRLA